LNGLVFMLIGLELPVIVNQLEGYSMGEAITYALVISGVIIITRIGFTLASSVFTHYISRVITTADANPGWRGPLIVGWAGMRGVVSLASALSIPLLLDNGEAFPQLNLILFITFVVILVTLVLQGLTLPLVIRWVKYNDPDESRPSHIQEAEIRANLSSIALKRFEEKYGEINDNDLLRSLRLKFNKDVNFKSDHTTEEAIERQSLLTEQYAHALIDLIEVQRKELHKLRKSKEYDHEVIRNMEAQMDLEEEKLQLQLSSRRHG
jgi:monovalent cation/hydrogen antiporter